MKIENRKWHHSNRLHHFLPTSLKIQLSTIFIPRNPIFHRSSRNQFQVEREIPRFYEPKKSTSRKREQRTRIYGVQDMQQAVLLKNALRSRYVATYLLVSTDNHDGDFPNYQLPPCMSTAVVASWVVHACMCTALGNISAPLLGFIRLLSFVNAFFKWNIPSWINYSWLRLITIKVTIIQRINHKFNQD